jgi:hypothetical protein
LITPEVIQNTINQVSEAYDHIGRFTVCCSQEFAPILRREFPDIEVVVFPKNSGVDDKVFLIKHRDWTGEFV